MKDLQARHKDWCEKNFGGKKPKVSSHPVDITTDVIRLVGEMAHHALKARQGIRGNSKDHENSFDSAIDTLSEKTSDAALEGFEWDIDSYGDDCWTHLDEPLLGVQEELGELLGCALQDIEARIDAVGDIVLYLMDYCNKSGIDFEDAVRVTAEKVHARDWVSNPVNGEVGE